MKTVHKEIVEALNG